MLCCQIAKNITYFALLKRTCVRVTIVAQQCSIGDGEKVAVVVAAVCQQCS